MKFKKLSWLFLKKGDMLINNIIGDGFLTCNFNGTSISMTGMMVCEHEDEHENTLCSFLLKDKVLIVLKKYWRVNCWTIQRRVKVLCDNRILYISFLEAKRYCVQIKVE